MIVNVQKHFSFNRAEENYEVDYLFTNKTIGDPVNGLFLTLHISVNGSEKKLHKINKPTSILYQSNEAIEHIIEEDAIAL